MKVPAVPTPVTPEQMGVTLRAAWRELFDTPPSDRTVALLLAHWAHETGRGKSMKNYNVGNIKAPDPSSKHTYFRTWEVLSPAQAQLLARRSTPEAPCQIMGRTESGYMHVNFAPEHPICRFRSYDTLHEGVCDYLIRLKSRFGRAWEPLCDGDVYAFVHSLKAVGYMTADVAPYYRSMQCLADEFLKRINGEAPPFNVEQIQKALAALGFYRGKVDGDFGKLTRAAVIAFQDAHGLDADGKVGPLTSSELQRQVLLKTSNGEPIA